MSATLIRIALILALVAGSWSTGSWAVAADESTVRSDASALTDLEFFRTQVQPILQEHCWKCHNGAEKKGGLDLSNRGTALAGGELGAAVDLLRPNESLLLSAVRYEGLEMPPSGQLAEDQVHVLQQWIVRGLPWDPAAAVDHPADNDADDSASGEPYISDSDRAHWSFQPIRRPARPEIPPSEWIRSPIDAFVWQPLHEQGLSPNPIAEPRVLIRRLYYDLIGLPPSPDAVESFVHDARPDAYEHLVDQLLSSPQFGEHWARHWLDLVRYAETDSFERDNAKPNAWKYRDYVIQSINANKSYRQFVMEQLAGDELDTVTNDSIIATGFYRLGLWDDEPTDAVQAYYDHLDDVVTITGQAMMGLTINCARCHDHKIDPIAQADYYRFMAFFHNIYKNTKTEGETAFKTPFTLNTQRDLASAEQRSAFETLRQQFERSMQQQRDAAQRLEERVVASLSAPEREDARDEGVRRRLIDEKSEMVLGEVDAAKLRELQQQLRTAKPPQADFPQALSIRENGRVAPQTVVLIRGSAHAPGEPVQPGFPEVLGFPAPTIPTPAADAESAGQRRVLAEWLFEPQHPLTARVIANRLWQHHFGRGIVHTSNDFGMQGAPPTHPKLLDWLADELRRSDWDLKHLHRLIVTSSTYRMTSADNPDAYARDPQNDGMWRAELRRLTAEQLRDAILSTNGSLDSRMGGPSIYPQIPQAVLQGQSRPGAGWEQSSPSEQARRSIYVFIKRSLPVPLLADFDAPDSDFSCPVRFVTTQPTQALSLLNSEELGRQATAFATFLRRTVGDEPSQQVHAALQRAAAREPDSDEIARGVKLMEVLQAQHGLTRDQALQQFCLMVLNLNEFIYLD